MLYGLYTFLQSPHETYLRGPTGFPANDYNDTQCEDLFIIL